MIVKNPEVTLDEDGHGFPKEALPTAMADWSCVANVLGDDGRQYWFDTVPIKAWGVDMWIMGIRYGEGKVIQSPNSIYRIADFPQGMVSGWHTYPAGALTIKRSDHEVAVDLGDFHLTCRDDHTWHYNIEDKAKGIKAEVVHTGIGYPTWYGKEKPQVYTPHCVAYGYFWAGRIEGTLTIEGRKVGIKGKGVRERYYAVDTCPVEVGGWHDWLWFHFDEMFGTIDEMKLTKHKDMSLYITDEKKYFPAATFNIEHHDWAYIRRLGAFIPTRYKVTVETEAGVLEMAANMVGCHVWAVSGEVPDSPTATLHWDKVEGIFTYKDGRKRTLTNGLGGNLIRQWKPYPNVLTLGLAGSEAPEADKEFNPM